MFYVLKYDVRMIMCHNENVMSIWFSSRTIIILDVFYWVHRKDINFVHEVNLMKNIKGIEIYFSGLENAEWYPIDYIHDFIGNVFEICFSYTQLKFELNSIWGVSNDIA